jgi:hypothetical protein
MNLENQKILRHDMPQADFFLHFIGYSRVANPNGLEEVVPRRSGLSDSLFRSQEIDSCGCLFSKIKMSE